MRSWDRIARLLCAPRPLPVLLAISVLLGAAYALSMLPLTFVAGTGDFWTYPSPILARGSDDAVQVEVGHLALAETPWTLPLLYTPLLNAPDGINIFWMDAVPWLSLLGRAIHSVTGRPVNLLGFFILGCLALPAVAMTALLAAAGARGLIAAVTGSLIAVTTPYLLFQWGHVPHSAHVWILVGLTLYLLHRRRPRDWRLAVAWPMLLPFVLLTNVYLFAMTSACWVAALVQRRIDGAISTRRAAAELASVAATIVPVMALTGILSRNLASVGAFGFGWWSMNLLGPVVPQMSGLVPPLHNFVIGMPGQYEGFAWLGSGVLLLGALTARAWVRWERARAQAHAVLLAIFALFFLFALSDRVFAGTHLLFALELPPRIVEMLGTFRASGRFFWPLGYAFAAGSIVLVLRTYRPAVSVSVLAMAAVLQIIDVEPLRSAIADSAARSDKSYLDRAMTATLVQRAREVRVFPTYECAMQAFYASGNTDREPTQERLNLELELLAVRYRRPINSVYTARLGRDCAVEAQQAHEPLRPGILYVWLSDGEPDTAQVADAAPNACGSGGNFHWCLLPEK